MVQFCNSPTHKGIRWAIAIILITVIVITAGCSREPENAFTIALTGKYPPFSFPDSEGRLVGFDVDVSRAIAKRVGKKLDIVRTEWDGILAGLLAGKYDAIIGSMAITPERAKNVNFSEPYYVSGAQLFVHRNNKWKISSIKDCKGKPIGVGLGETYEHYLRNNYPEVQVVTYKSTPDIFQDMKTGRLVGFVTDRLVGAWNIKKHHRPFIPVGKLLYEERMGIPVKKDRPELLKQINAALRDMKSSGELDRLFEGWFGLEEQAQ